MSSHPRLVRATDRSEPVGGELPATLLLRTVGGAEDLLIEQVRSIGRRPHLRAPGVVDLDPGPVDRWAELVTDLRDLRFYSGAAMQIDRPAGDPAITTAVRSLQPALPADPRPDVEHSAQVIELTGLHWPQRHHRLLRLPWSTAPVLGEVMVRLAKVGPGMTVLDPCCGSATILITATRAGAGSLIGTDHDPRAIATARANVEIAGGSATLLTADASRLPMDSGTIDRVISNLPFGKLVGSHPDNRRLYPRLLAEIDRVLTRSGRAVLLTEDKRILAEAVQRTPGLKIIRTRVLRYSGVHPTAFVLGRTRSRLLS